MGRIRTLAPCERGGLKPDPRRRWRALILNDDQAIGDVMIYADQWLIAVLSVASPPLPGD